MSEYFIVIPSLNILITSLCIENFNLSQSEMFQFSTVNIILIISYNILKNRLRRNRIIICLTSI